VEALAKPRFGRGIGDVSAPTTGSQAPVHELKRRGTAARHAVGCARGETVESAVRSDRAGGATLGRNVGPSIGHAGGHLDHARATDPAGPLRRAADVGCRPPNRARTRPRRRREPSRRVAHAPARQRKRPHQRRNRVRAMATVGQLLHREIRRSHPPRRLRLPATRSRPVDRRSDGSRNRTRALVWIFGIAGGPCSRSAEPLTPSSPLCSNRQLPAIQRRGRPCR